MQVVVTFVIVAAYIFLIKELYQGIKKGTDIIDTLNSMMILTLYLLYDILIHVENEALNLAF